VHAQDAVIDEGSHWHFLEQFVNPLEKGAWVINIFLQLCLALIGETHASVDFDVLVRAPQQEDILGVFDFEGEQQE
jgi:hypothetical protein